MGFADQPHRFNDQVPQTLAWNPLKNCTKVFASSIYPSLDCMVFSLALIVFNAIFILATLSLHPLNRC